MTEDQFRNLALSLPEAVESAHIGHADFRIRNKIFATLAYLSEGCGVVMLTPQEQRRFLRTEPGVFTPVPGGWGRRGATKVKLASASEETLRPALVAAWRKVAPKGLAEEHDIEE
jgi:hypothetical protein